MWIRKVCKCKSWKLRRTSLLANCGQVCEKFRTVGGRAFKNLHSQVSWKGHQNEASLCMIGKIKWYLLISQTKINKKIIFALVRPSSDAPGRPPELNGVALLSLWYINYRYEIYHAMQMISYWFSWFFFFQKLSIVKF